MQHSLPLGRATTRSVGSNIRLSVGTGRIRNVAASVTGKFAWIARDAPHATGTQERSDPLLSYPRRWLQDPRVKLHGEGEEDAR